LPRSAEKRCAIPARVTLKDANHIDEAVEIAQLQNSGRVIRCADISRVMDRRTRPRPPGFAGRTEGYACHDSYPIPNKGIPGPDWQPSFENVDSRQALAHGDNHATLGFLSVGGEEKGQTKQVHHLGSEQSLEVFCCRIFDH
jgi:hypothetical protein